MSCIVFFSEGAYHKLTWHSSDAYRALESDPHGKVLVFPNL